MENLLSGVTTSVRPETRSRFNPLNDASHQLGLILTLLSASLYGLSQLAYLEFDRSNQFALFLIHFVVAVAYAVYLKVCDRFTLEDGNYRANMGGILLLMVLSLISCYALNRDIPVFQEATPWLSVYLVVSGLAWAGFGFRDYLSGRLQWTLYFLLGASLLLMVYLSIYVLPISGIALIGMILLGIGFHAFIPLMAVISLCRVVEHTWKNERRHFYALLAGAAFPLLVLVTMLGFWDQRLKLFTHEHNQTVLNANDQLPQWVYLSQRIPADWLTERLLKTELVYEVPRNSNDFFMGIPSTSTFDAKHEHDPLVLIATKLSGTLPLEREEKIRVLEAMYDARHQTQERLWSGTDLRTVNVATNVRLFPESRLAYTEQTLNVRNTMKNVWRTQQEAIYTFHLPEGAVVTSLSLWINGREEKAYLTTKGKAEKAYKTIVGVESRDPSVVHWQEGNQVSVRVFPCTNVEDRRVKIGITSPLQAVGDQLVYSSIYFDGPTALGATESVRVKTEGKPVKLELPYTFETTQPGVFSREGDYWSDWKISMPTPDTRNQLFSFGGKTYQTEPYVPVLAPFQAQAYYLDLNESWTKTEMEEVWELLKGKKVYVYDQQLIELTDENQEELFEWLGELRYSLFPLHVIKDPGSSLLISKSTPQSPNLRDLKESTFSHQLMAFLAKKQRLRMYNLGSEVSPYLRTLKEFRVLEYDQGDVRRLGRLLNQHQFVSTAEDDGAVVIGSSGMRIRQVETAAVGQAPNHLLRLFAYNHILHHIGQDYFNQDYINETLIREAELANVVSPVSSLIVLETQADYERFDITKSKDSLGNASVNSSGAVPEPHEWILIGLVLVIAVYLAIKTYW